MKPFELESKMVTLSGVFYPTGYMFLMLPSEQEARDAAKLLADDGLDSDAISLLTPADIQEKIVSSVGGSGVTMPSAGTEADTVRKFAELASQGHYSLLIHAPSADESTHVMEVLKDAKLSYGQKYRQLVIEDLVD